MYNVRKINQKLRFRKALKDLPERGEGLHVALLGVCNLGVQAGMSSVTSGNKIKVERKCHDAEEARASARCIFASNTLPTLTDKTNGVWDRIRIIPFDQVFRGTDKQNTNLTEELKEELPAS